MKQASKPANGTTRRVVDDLADCRILLIRMVGRIESCVGPARAAAATIPILTAVGEVEEMRRWAERREAEDNGRR